MSNVGTLFEALARYSIDTNVIVSFLREHEAEPYPMDVFKPQWDFLQKSIRDGRVVAARRVETELAKWHKTIPTIKSWLSDNKHMFCDIETEQLSAAKRIVNAYPAYGSNENYLGDLEVMTLAMARNLTVVSLEHRAQQHSKKRPKIPNICDEFGIACTGLAGFLRAEGFSGG
ncbi:DUF4411 family protein [Nocardioides sp. NPDC126508]